MKSRRDLLRLQSHPRAREQFPARLVVCQSEKSHSPESKPRRNLLCVQLAALTLLSSVRSALYAAENEGSPVIPSEVAIRWGEPCDTHNTRLYIENSHTFRTAIVYLRWKAAGGKQLEERFVLEPAVISEIGCAEPGAAITRAELADF